MHACRYDCQMAVGRLAGPSRNLKPSFPVPTWPVLTSTIPELPPLARRPLAVVTDAHTSIVYMLFKQSRVNYSCNEPFTQCIRSHNGPVIRHNIQLYSCSLYDNGLAPTRIYARTTVSY